MEKIDGLKCSDALKIEAAVIERAEKVTLEVTEDTRLQPGKVEGTLMITLQFPKLSLDRIDAIRKELEGFTLELFGKGKSGLFLSVSGKKEVFIKLLDKPAIPPVNHGYQGKVQ